jgi:hypothetical protein
MKNAILDAWMLRSVALLRTDVSEERIIPIRNISSQPTSSAEYC